VYALRAAKVWGVFRPPILAVKRSVYPSGGNYDEVPAILWGHSASVWLEQPFGSFLGGGLAVPACVDVGNAGLPLWECADWVTTPLSRPSGRVATLMGIRNYGNQGTVQGRLGQNACGAGLQGLIPRPCYDTGGAGKGTDDIAAPGVAVCGSPAPLFSCLNTSS
jgi:hypothetical protein